MKTDRTTLLRIILLPIIFSLSPIIQNYYYGAQIKYQFVLQVNLFALLCFSIVLIIFYYNKPFSIPEIDQLQKRYYASVIFILGVFVITMQSHGVTIFSQSEDGRGELLNSFSPVHRILLIISDNLQLIWFSYFLLKQNAKLLLFHCFLAFLGSLLFLSRSGLMEPVFFILLFWPTFFIRTKQGVLTIMMLFAFVLLLVILQARSTFSAVNDIVLGIIFVFTKYFSYSSSLYSYFPCQKIDEFVGGFVITNLKKIFGYEVSIGTLITDSINLSTVYGSWSPANVFYPLHATVAICVGVIGVFFTITYTSFLLMLPRLLKSPVMFPIMIYIVFVDSIFQNPFYRSNFVILILLSFLMFIPNYIKVNRT